MTTLHFELTALADELLADGQAVTFAGAKQIAHVQLESCLRYAERYDKNALALAGAHQRELERQREEGRQREQTRQATKTHQAQVRAQLRGWKAQLKRLREDRESLPASDHPRLDASITVALSQIDSLSEELGE